MTATDELITEAQARAAARAGGPPAPGATGPVHFDGPLPVILDDPQPGDVLERGSDGVWRNQTQQTITGVRGVYRGNWAASTAYKANDLVAYNGATYSAKADFTSGASFNAANWNTLSVASSGGGLPPTVATVTTSTTLAANKFTPADASGGAITQTLPAPTAVGDVIAVEKVDSTANPVTVTGTIRGSTASIALSLANEEILLVAESTNSWRPYAGHKTLTSLDARFNAKFAWQGAVAANTTYHAGDVLVYRGRRIVATQTFTTGAAPVTFISAANYVPLAAEFTFNAADWGSLGGSTADVAIQAALNEAFNMSLGATVLLPEGVFVVSAQIDIPWGCTLEGAGKMSTVIQPADGSDLVPIRVHKSTGSGNANAAFASVRHLGINGRKSTMSSATAHGLILETNPLLTGQSGTSGTHVEYFDPHHTVESVAIRSCLGNGLHMLGRSAHHIRDVWTDSCDGYGIQATFDTTLVHCEAQSSGKAGFLINNGSVRAIGCKSYLNGRITNTEPGYDIGANGNFASLQGCDSQNNGGPGYRVGAATAVTIFGTADGNGLLSYGAGAQSAVELNGAVGAIVNVGAINSPQGGSEIGAQRYGLKMTAASAKCSVVMSNAAVAPATILGDVDPASVISAGNSVRMNGATLTEKVSTLADVTVASPSDGQVLTYDAAAGRWKNLPGGSTAFLAGAFGDGSDGAVTLDGTVAAPSGITKSGSTYTLGRDMHFSSLTITSAATLVPNGYRIFCQGAFVNQGAINALGNDGTAAGVAGTNTGTGSLSGGRSGGAGNTGNGGGGTPGGVGMVAAGAGGAGSTGTSGTAGTVSSNQTAWLRQVNHVLAGTMAVFGTLSAILGGPGGGGGGGDGTNKGGGGGGGGGIVAILAGSVNNSGTISVKGGNGGAPATGNAGGGGGGSGGLILVYTKSAWTNTGTTTVTGGTGGAGIGTGTAGANGGAGSVLNIVVS